MPFGDETPSVFTLNLLLCKGFFINAVRKAAQCCSICELVAMRSGTFDRKVLHVDACLASTSVRPHFGCTLCNVGSSLSFVFFDDSAALGVLGIFDKASMRQRIGMRHTIRMPGIDRETGDMFEHCAGC